MIVSPKGDRGEPAYLSSTLLPPPLLLQSCDARQHPRVPTPTVPVYDLLTRTVNTRTLPYLSRCRGEHNNTASKGTHHSDTWATRPKDTLWSLWSRTDSPGKNEKKVEKRSIRPQFPTFIRLPDDFPKIQDRQNPAIEEPLPRSLRSGRATSRPLRY